MADGKKTLAEHQEYVEQMARLSFFFARRWLEKRMPEKTIGELLRDHTPLLYHALNYTDHETKWDNPACLGILAKADELKVLPPTKFEEQMWSEVTDLAVERAERFYPTSVGMGVSKEWNAGSLKYDPPVPGLPPNYCNFHIANAVSPKSIFDDPEYLPHCFIELMARSKKEHGYDTLHTATWLDDHHRWLALFPQEWIDNLSPRTNDVSWNFGNWGQMVTARGTFNRNAGQYLREHGELKYKCRRSHCSFAAMRKHLTTVLKAIGTF